MSDGGRSKLLCAILIGALVLSAFAILAPRAEASVTEVPVLNDFQSPVTEGIVESVEEVQSPVTSMDKIASPLRDIVNTKGSSEVLITTANQPELASLLNRIDVRRPVEDDREPGKFYLKSTGTPGKIVSQRVIVPNMMLDEIANLAGVVSIEPPSTPELMEYTDLAVEEEKALLKDWKTGMYERPELPNPTAYGTVNEVGATQVWADFGYNGTGVKVAVLDTGIDFAHPNIVGQWATDDNPGSPHYGWPVMLHAYSLDLMTGLWTAGSDWDRYPYPVFASYGEASWYSDTSYTVDVSATGYLNYSYGVYGQYVKRYNPDGYGGPPDLNLISREYFVGIPGNPGTIESASGWYHLGINKDDQLTSIYAERVGVLVVDSTTPFVYDTVYVDLDNDLDFTDEIGCSKASPLCYKDVTGDGHPDLSGGLLYYMSDTTASITGETVIASAVGDEASASLANGYIVSDIVGYDTVVTVVLYQDGNYWPSATETIYQDLITGATGNEQGTSVFLDATSLNINTGASVDATWVLHNYGVSFIYYLGNDTDSFTEGVDFTLDYATGEITWLRDLTVGDNVFILYQFDTWTFDFTTGEITFNAPPIAGAAVVTDYETGIPIPWSVQHTAERPYDNYIPASGDIVALYGSFNIDTYHGTSLASSIAGRPVNNSFGILDAYGTSPGAKIIGIEIYDYNSPLDLFSFSIRGYDGIPGTGDEANIVVNGWAYTSELASGWRDEDRGLYDMLLNEAPNVTFAFGSGATGPGYGTMKSLGSGPGVLTVGIGVDMNYRYLLGVDEGEAYYCWPTLGEGASGCGPYGDVSTWSGRGPTMLGTAKPDVMAVGSNIIGAHPLNYAINAGWGTDGLNAWDLIGSSGISAAVGGGILALQYQAYKQKNGDWPSWSLAIDTLSSTSDDHGLDILSQGAGWINASRSVEAMTETAGILPDMARWLTGNYDGVKRPGFINFMTPGSSENLTITLTNYEATDEIVTISDAVFAKAGEISWNWNLSTVWPDPQIAIFNETGVYEADGGPIRLSDTSSLWASADFIKVNVVRDPRNLTTTPSSYLEVFDWFDVVNISMYDGIKERNRMSYALPGEGANVISATVYGPSERIHDGLIISLTDLNNATGFSLAVVEFYEKVDWNWLTDASSGNVLVSSGGTASFTATLDVPPGTASGSYDGAIYLEDSYGRTTTIPILVNVLCEEFPSYFGGDVPATSLYDNNAFTQGQMPNQHRQIGDNRYYWVQLPNLTVEANSKLINDLYWTQNVSEGEIYFYTQAVDPTWTNDSIYGPSTMSFYASTHEILGRKNTDIPNGEYLSTDVVNGLVAVQYRSFAATMVSEPITGVFGNLTVESDVIHIYTESLAGRRSVEVVSNVPLLNGLSLGVSGLVEENFTGLHVDPYPYTGGPFSEYLYNAPNKVVTFVPIKTIQAKWTLFFTPAASDVDMGNFYDDNCDGVYTVDDNVDTGLRGATSSNPEVFSVQYPPSGCYWVHLAGYDVPPGGATADLYFSLSLLLTNGTFEYENYPTVTVPANTPVTFDTVWNFTSLAAGTILNETLVIDPGKAPLAWTQYVTIYLHYFAPPAPPTNVTGELTGLGLQDLAVTWSLSKDDGFGVESYVIFRSNQYDSSGSGYSQVGVVPNGTNIFLDAGSGEGNPENYFYIVCARPESLIESCASEQAGKFTRPLLGGPNLVSVPLIQSDESIETVLQTVRYDKAWYYDSYEEWKWHMPFKGYSRGLWSVNHSIGLWINMTGLSNLTVAGVVPTQTTIHLYAGWNLVSFPSFNATYAISDLIAETGATRVEGYDLVSPYCLKVLGPAEILETGFGYWVKVDADTVWTVEIA